MVEASSAQAQQIQEQLGKNWWILLVWGIAAIVIGAFLVLRPGITALVLVQVMAIFWLIGGIADTIQAMATRDEGWGWRLAAGILGIVAGLFIITHPILGTEVSLTFLFLVVVFVAIISGIVDIVEAIRIGRQAGFDFSWGHFFLGILKILLGVLLLEHPAQGTLTLVLVIGVFTLIGGIAASIMAYRIKELTAL